MAADRLTRNSSLSDNRPQPSFNNVVEAFEAHLPRQEETVHLDKSYSASAVIIHPRSRALHSMCIKLF